MWIAWQVGWSLVSIAPLTSTGWLTMGASSCLAGVSHLDSVCFDKVLKSNLLSIFSNWTCKELVQLLDGIEQFGKGTFCKIDGNYLVKFKCLNLFNRPRQLGGRVQICGQPQQGTS